MFPRLKTGFHPRFLFTVLIPEYIYLPCYCCIVMLIRSAYQSAINIDNGSYFFAVQIKNCGSYFFAVQIKNCDAILMIDFCLFGNYALVTVFEMETTEHVAYVSY